MLGEVKELGILTLKEKKKSALDVFIESINSRNYPHIVAIILEKQSDKYIYKKVELEETDTVNPEKYLYKKGSPRGSNFSPTAMTIEVENTFQNKILNWFQSIKRNKSQEVLEIFTEVEKALIEKKGKILKDINSLAKDIKSFAITLKIDDKYLYDMAEFKDAFLTLILEKNEKIAGEDKTCSICGEKKLKVYGGASPFKFYTIDKPGFITGEFNEELSWRNFPVCGECSLALNEGKNIIENSLKFRFYGLEYMLVPNFIFGKEGKDLIIEIIKKRLDKNILLKNETGSSLVTAEDDILYFLSDMQDNLTLHFLFIKKQQGAERIILLIDDIFPSRIRKLFSAKKAVDQLFSRIPFHFGKIRTFFVKSDPGKRDNDLDKYFLEIIDAVFKGKNIDFKFLALNYMREIRREFKNEQSDQFFYKTIDAIESTLFFNNLNLLSVKEESIVQTQFDSIFEKYSLNMDTNVKRGIFLLGALTKMLLNIQKRERQSQPFLSQLKGLKMNQKDMQGLLPKVEAKLEEYKRFDKGKRIVAEEISRLLLSSESKWKLSVDEINFYFVCGMNLYNDINQMLYDKKEDEPSDEQSNDSE